MTDTTDFLAEAKHFVASETARLDKEYYDHQAARALFRLHRKLDQDSSFDAIARRLDESVATALKDRSKLSLEEALIKQTYVLEATFHYLIAEAAEDKYDCLRQYHAAFSAQKLYRQTYEKLNQALIADKRAEKRKNKTAERTEQKTGVEA